MPKHAKSDAPFPKSLSKATSSLCVGGVSPFLGLVFSPKIGQIRVSSPKNLKSAYAKPITNLKSTICS